MNDIIYKNIFEDWTFQQRSFKMEFDASTSEFTISDVRYVIRNKLNIKKPYDFSGKRPIGYLSCRFSGCSEIKLSDRTLRPDTEHYFLCPANTEYTQHYLEEELVVVHINFTKDPPVGAELIYNTSPEVKEEFIQLYRCWSEKQLGYLIKSKYILYHIFYLLTISGHQQKNTKIKNSIEWLYRNYLRHDFSISEMIGKSYMSEAYFRRIFRELYGCGIVEFVNRLRIEYAKTLIESCNYSIHEVALMTGFTDEKYFSQVFRKIVGCVPSKFNR